MPRRGSTSRRRRNTGNEAGDRRRRRRRRTRPLFHLRWWWIGVTAWTVFAAAPQPARSCFRCAPLTSSRSSSSLALRPRRRGPSLVPATPKRRDLGDAGILSSGGDDGGDPLGDGPPKGSSSRRRRRHPRSLVDRRSWVSFLAATTTASLQAGWSSSAVVVPGGSPPAAVAATSAGGGRLTDSVLRSLVFERVLGSGSFKTVYLVSSAAAIPDDNDDAAPTTTTTARYALAVERLRTKREVKNAFRGVEIPERIRKGLVDDDAELFERILDWWIQPSDLPEFERGARVFPGMAGRKKNTEADDAILGRTRSEPGKNFAGSRWMLSFKPVYDTDLKRFVRNAPVLAPVGTARSFAAIQGRGGGGAAAAATDDDWTEPILLAFVLDLLRAGRLMHEAGIVHRDIKPKNLMIRTASSGGDRAPKKRRPVIIDYGYAGFGDPTPLQETTGRESGGDAERRDVCVVQAGNLKGEVDYALAEDLERYRGCQRGDAYAMGKSLYEFVFGSADDLLIRRGGDGEDPPMMISVEGAAASNAAFRELLASETAGTASRFPLSKTAADRLLSILRGLCRSSVAAGGGTTTSSFAKVPSFADAEAALKGYVVAASSGEGGKR